MRPFRHFLFLFAIIVLITSAILAFQRRHSSGLMWIAFTRASGSYMYGGPGSLLRILPNGNGLQHLGASSAYRNSPLEWSPDGTQIVYSTDECETGCMAVYSINFITRHTRLLTDFELTDGFGQWSPRWSSDGGWLYFWTSGRIYNQMRPDGAQPTVLAANIRNVAISPDDTLLAFSIGHDSEPSKSLFVRSLDGGADRLLMNDLRYYEELAWSPDGRYLAFVSSHDSHAAIFLFTIATRERRVLTAHFLSVGSALVWSPDSRSLVFAATDQRESSDYDIFRVDIDDTSLHQLTHDIRIVEHSLGWSRDGRWISFITENRTIEPQDFVDSNLMLMRPDGSDQHIVPNTFSAVNTPTWSPIIDLPFAPSHLIILSVIIVAFLTVLPRCLRRHQPPKMTRTLPST